MNVSRDTKDDEEEKTPAPSNTSITPSNIACFDLKYYYLFFNEVHKEAAQKVWGADIERGVSLLDCIPSQDERLAVQCNLDRAISGEIFIEIKEYGDIQGHVWECIYAPMYDAEGNISGVSVTSTNITERTQVEKALHRSEVLEKLATGAPLTEILDALVVNAEKHNQEILCSVLLVDKNGKHLRHASAPSLPDFYNQAIDGIKIDSAAGSCAAAVHSGKRVIVEDVLAHPNWDNYRELAEKANLRACWSDPIISSTGNILGTFAIYFREPRKPTQSDLDFIGDSARLAAIAIEHKQAEQATLDLLQQNRDLAHRMFQLQEEERKYIARELHDELGQWLTAIHLNAQAISLHSKELNPIIYDNAQVINVSVSEMHKSIRGMIRQLRPALLSELGLVDSLRGLFDQWQAQYPTINSRLILEGALSDFEDNLNITIYRIIQESMTNVVKHARSSNVVVQLVRQSGEKGELDSLLLTIEDDGEGMDTSLINEGIGLLGMRERAFAIGGDFSIKSKKGEGVRINARFPIKPQED